MLTVVALMALVGTLLLDTTPPDHASATPEVEQEHEAFSDGDESFRTLYRCRLIPGSNPSAGRSSRTSTSRPRR